MPCGRDQGLSAGVEEQGRWPPILFLPLPSLPQVSPAIRGCSPLRVEFWWEGQMACGPQAGFRSVALVQVMGPSTGVPGHRVKG